MNFDVSFCNSRSGKMIKSHFKFHKISEAAQLRCGGKHENFFVANFLLYPTVKEF